MVKKITIVTGLVYFWIATTYGGCPSPMSILPCTCSLESSNPIIICKNITSEDDFMSVMTATKKQGIFGVRLNSASLMYFQDGVFFGTSIKSMEILDSSLFAISESDLAFTGLEKSLMSLKVTNCTYANNWEFTQLQKLKKLHNLEISNSNLLELSEKFLKIADLPLEEINFKENFIDEIPYRAFANFTGLIKLSLDLNQLTGIMRSMLPIPAQKLKTLGLSYNNIKTLPVNAFYKMPALTFLYLGGNPIHTLNSKTFLPIWKRLTMAFFQESPLICDCQLSWIATAKRSKLAFISGRCSHPRHLRGKHITELATDDLHC